MVKRQRWWTSLDSSIHVMQMNPVWKLETFCSTINVSLDFRIPEPPHKQLWPFLAEDFVSWRNVQSDGFIEVQFMRTQSSPLFWKQVTRIPQKPATRSNKEHQEKKNISGGKKNCFTHPWLFFTRCERKCFFMLPDPCGLMLRIFKCKPSQIITRPPSSYKHGSGKWLFLKGNYCWRDPFFTERCLWEEGYFSDLVIQLQSTIVASPICCYRQTACLTRKSHNLDPLNATTRMKSSTVSPESDFRLTLRSHYPRCRLGRWGKNSLHRRESCLY